MACFPGYLTGFLLPPAPPPVSGLSELPPSRRLSRRTRPSARPPRPLPPPPLLRTDPPYPSIPPCRSCRVVRDASQLPKVPQQAPQPRRGISERYKNARVRASKGIGAEFLAPIKRGGGGAIRCRVSAGFPRAARPWFPA
jgi:hypothetical protein